MPDSVIRSPEAACTCPADQPWHSSDCPHFETATFEPVLSGDGITWTPFKEWAVGDFVERSKQLMHELDEKRSLSLTEQYWRLLMLDRQGPFEFIQTETPPEPKPDERR